jgi:hypothetical protein
VIKSEICNESESEINFAGTGSLRNINMCVHPNSKPSDKNDSLF